MREQNIKIGTVGRFPENCTLFDLKTNNTIFTSEKIALIIGKIIQRMKKEFYV